MKYLDASDCVKIIRVCQSWSGTAAEAFYASPPYNSKLQALFDIAKPTHPYPLLVRELVFSGWVEVN
jgi:hypothetical protein